MRAPPEVVSGKPKNGPWCQRIVLVVDFSFTRRGDVLDVISSLQMQLSVGLGSPRGATAECEHMRPGAPALFVVSRKLLPGACSKTLFRVSPLSSKCIQRATLGRWHSHCWVPRLLCWRTCTLRAVQDRQEQASLRH